MTLLRATVPGESSPVPVHTDRMRRHHGTNQVLSTSCPSQCAASDYACGSEIAHRLLLRSRKLQNPKPQADPADALIAQAEKQYAAGQANYQAGHLEAAKEDFDQAFNTLLTSNLDVRNDERLDREFEKIVEAVHGLELVRCSRAMASPSSAPSRRRSTKQRHYFPGRPNIRRRLKPRSDDKVRPAAGAERPGGDVHQLFFQSARAGHVGNMPGRARAAYHEMIARVLKEEGVPQDLIYLAQAESGFQPLALSRAGARGHVAVHARFRRSSTG